MKVLGIVPARHGSKRLPGKNLRVFGGQPLALWAMKTAAACDALDTVVVSSDDAEVLRLAASVPRVHALLRPSTLATDEAPALDYVKHALAQFSPAVFDAVVIIQPTSPLTVPADIAATLEVLQRTGADSAVSVMKLDHAIHPVKLKRLSGDRLLPYLEQEAGRMAAHELPELYVRNCAVYATRTHVIDSGVLLGADCRAFVMPRERSVDINDALDFALAELMLQRLASTSGAPPSMPAGAQ